MPEIIETTVYRLDELSDAAKDKDVLLFNISATDVALREEIVEGSLGADAGVHHAAVRVGGGGDRGDA